MKVTQQGTVSLVADFVDGVKNLHSDIFGVFDSRGNLYFSDSGEWKQGNGVVWRLSHQGKVELFAAGPFHFANGLALDAQERYLYVVESNRDRVVRIEIKSDGSSGSPSVFAEGLARVPDGMALDAARQSLRDDLRLELYLSSLHQRSRRASLPGRGELAALPTHQLRLWWPKL